eukprot:3923009-Rhodomonas_salina.1
MQCSYPPTRCKRTTRVGNLQADVAMGYLVKYHAQVHVPQDEAYFYKNTPDTEGTYVIRVDDYNGDGDLLCTIVQGQWTEVGCEVIFPYHPVETDTQ